MSDRNQHSVLLVGLDGSNPLAFLAALGTLRSLSIAWTGHRIAMSWTQAEGSWRPLLWTDRRVDESAIIDGLHTQLLTMREHPAFIDLGDNLNVDPDQFRRFASSAVVDALKPNGSRVKADFAAAFGCEACTIDQAGRTMIVDTALRTMSGAGHQHFLKFFREVVDKTDDDHLRRALFKSWDYRDEGRGMNLRWDPAYDRRYALRWNDPSGDPVTTMRGANRLAIEGLPLLPTMPVTGGLATTGFTGKGSRGTFMNWPIWSDGVGIDIVRSLLAHPVIVDSERRAERDAIGIKVVYQSQRITTGKFRNFTPAKAV